MQPRLIDQIIQERGPLDRFIRAGAVMAPTGKGTCAALAWPIVRADTCMVLITASGTEEGLDSVGVVGCGGKTYNVAAEMTLQVRIYRECSACRVINTNHSYSEVRRWRRRPKSRAQVAETHVIQLYLKRRGDAGTPSRDGRQPVGKTLLAR